MTECNGVGRQGKLSFSALAGRAVQADFSAGRVSSDGGGLLLREADRCLGLTQRLAECFRDYRRSVLSEHQVQELIAQRVYALALGYEDLNDHDALSRDPLLATLAGKDDVEGLHRLHPEHRGQPLASAATLGRVERTKADANARSRYEKVVCDFEALGRALVQMFIETKAQAPARLIVDVDPTDIELHGNQEQRFYHGYYGHYCYLPMHVFCGQYPLGAKLRPSNVDGAQGVVELLAPIVAQLRAAWPDVHIVVRADSGFCREELMSWCETHQVDYVLGVARNARLVRAVATQMEQARREHEVTGSPARRFRSFRYRTRETWSRRRRVVGKAEYMDKGQNPRFIVTSLCSAEFEKRYLYEELYCARGEMENRIKEQLELFADRASCHTFRGNEMRLWWAMAAHLLVVTVRQMALQGTVLERAQAATLRTRLFKIGALVTVSVRRIYVRLSSAFPLQALFALALQRLRGPAPAS